MQHVMLRFYFFFFNDTATTEIYTLSLHDALPIYNLQGFAGASGRPRRIPLAGKPLAQRIAHHQFVVDDQDPSLGSCRCWWFLYAYHLILLLVPFPLLPIPCPLTAWCPPSPPPSPATPRGIPSPRPVRY